MLKDLTGVMRANFSDIFDYAEKEFSIGWNAANDMFFNNSLNYKSFNEYDINEITEYFLQDVGFSELSVEAQGYFIIHQFMQDNNIREILIDNT